MKRDGGLVADIVAELIGWIFSFGMLLGAYMGGFWVSTWLALPPEHRPAISILAALAVIWNYEHRLAHDRWTKYINR